MTDPINPQDIPTSPDIPFTETNDSSLPENQNNTYTSPPPETIEIEHSSASPTNPIDKIKDKIKNLSKSPKGPLFITAGIVGIFIFVILIGLLIKSFRKPQPQLITLTYWGLWDSREIMQPLIDEYQKLHPNIRIEYIEQEFGHKTDNHAYVGNYYAAVVERVSKTGGVDIIRIHHSWLPNLAPFITAAPSGLFNIDELKEDLYKPALEAMIWQNLVVSVPLQIDSIVMFYNPTLLSKSGVNTPPKNWEEVLNIAPKLTKKQENTIVQAGIAIGTGSNIFHSPEILLMLFAQSDIPVIDLQNKQFTFATEEGLAALNYYVDFYRKGVWSYKLPMDLKMFAECRLAIMFAPSWRAINLLASNSELNFMVAPPPVLPGARPDVPQYISNFYVEIVPKNSPHAVEAWRFLKWLSEPQQIEKLSELQRQERGLAFPVARKSIGNQQDTINPIAKTVHEMAPKTKTIFLYDWGLWEQKVKTLLINIEADPKPDIHILRQLENDLNKSIFQAN